MMAWSSRIFSLWTQSNSWPLYLILILVLIKIAMRRWQILTLMATFSVTPTTSRIKSTTKALWNYLRPYSIAALRRIYQKTALISQVRMLTLFEVQVLPELQIALRCGLLARRFRHSAQWHRGFKIWLVESAVRAWRGICTLAICCNSSSYFYDEKCYKYR